MSSGIIVIGFLGLAGFLMYQIYQIRFKKKINIISCVNDTRFKKIKNKDRVAYDYSNILIFMTFGCIVTSVLAALLGTPVAYVGLIPIVWGSLMLSGFSAKIDEKIKKKIY